MLANSKMCRIGVSVYVYVCVRVYARHAEATIRIGNPLSTTKTVLLS